jgi:NADPH:quinone reductase-like Zn-dependent oxidoreductase
MRFDGVVHDIDIVFDTVGGDTLQRSWQVIKQGGVLADLPESSLNAFYLWTMACYNAINDFRGGRAYLSDVQFTGPVTAALPKIGT